MVHVPVLWIKFLFLFWKKNFYSLTALMWFYCFISCNLLIYYNFNVFFLNSILQVDLRAFLRSLSFLHLYSIQCWDSFRSLRRPPVIRRCPALLLGMAIDGSPVAIDRKENLKNGLFAWNSYFPCLHITIGNTCIEIQCNPMHGPLNH